MPNFPFDLQGKNRKNTGKYHLTFNTGNVGNLPVSKHAIKKKPLK